MTRGIHWITLAIVLIMMVGLPWLILRSGRRPKS